MIEQSWLYLSALVIFLILLLVFFKKVRAKQEIDPNLSQKERMFTSILEKAVGEQYRVICKVPMEHVFEAESGLSDRAKKKVTKPLKSLQFDYIVCAVNNSAVICAVELDDHEYHKKRHKQQDLFIEELCYEAGLPLLRVAPQNGYNLVEIIERFERTISAPNTANSELSQAQFSLKMVDVYRPQPG
ncbi:DUF2726 domain-containing protein [Neptuniibacter sp. 1_MG-2023]|uniref:DUF2726 domain-containing protein n=1 Tax=Neptuniibacter sp. 1_MG-2023 TaxID=3062662 RepID=UPI0026E34D02|nr:DUF2726 domain-containing protein [Neptuniibacter sp. 1_MG-2023]MDO6594876.1 DUF2726 domain-containing protein [Neptuniibacter sp. 1_MG-2023]